ncbi:MAG: flagellar assembly protein FliW [Desulfuromonas sp.]|jgi:flagellar assembly factor FliW|nr:MAG: flagellar assembly protein FliW [Desulfuromonas sp.]
MKTIQSRFGEIEYDPENVVTFPEGLIGFENLRDFIVMPNKKEGLLFWIQSVEDPEVALVLTDPTNFFLTYKVVPEEGERAKLDISEEDDSYSLVVVTVSPQQEVTFNLMAPILFAPKTNRAIQVILEKSGYSTREPLPKIEAS